VPSHIVAQESIAILTTPLLARFLDLMRNADEDDCRALADRLQDLCGGLTPAVWAVRLNAAQAPATHHMLVREERLALGDILRDSRERSERLPVVALMVERLGQAITLPPDDFVLDAGDNLLFASSLDARRRLELTLANANELAFVVHGRDNSGSWLWQRLRRTGAS
jgi:hypothetical protein